MIYGIFFWIPQDSEEIRAIAVLTEISMCMSSVWQESATNTWQEGIKPYSKQIEEGLFSYTVSSSSLICIGLLKPWGLRFSVYSKRFLISIGMHHSAFLLPIYLQNSLQTYWQILGLINILHQWSFSLVLCRWMLLFIAFEFDMFCLHWLSLFCCFVFLTHGSLFSTCITMATTKT